MEIPILDNVWVSLFLGMVMLTFSGIIFREFDPLGGLEKAALRAVHSVHSRPHREEFTYTYHDKLMKKDVHIRADKVHAIEKNVLAIREKGKETFVPIHRIKAVHHKRKLVWEL